jgi:hypothetical protein
VALELGLMWNLDHAGRVLASSPLCHDKVARSLGPREDGIALQAREFLRSSYGGFVESSREGKQAPPLIAGGHPLQIRHITNPETLFLNGGKPFLKHFVSIKLVKIIWFWRHSGGDLHLRVRENRQEHQVDCGY